MTRNQNQSGFIPALLLLLAVSGFLTLGVGGYKYLAKERLKNTPQVSVSTQETEKTEPTSLVQSSTPQVAGLSTTTPEVKTIVRTQKLSTEQVRLAVADEMKALLAQGLLQGPKGEKGDKGGSVATPDSVNNLGQVLGISTQAQSTPLPQYAPIFYNPGNPQTLQSPISSIGATNITTDKLSVNQNFTVTGNSSLNGNISVTGSISSSGVEASIARNVTAGRVDSSDLLTMNGGGSFYNENQHWVQVGSDGYPRFVYIANGYTEVRFVQCTNSDCSTKVNTVLVTNSNGVDAPTLKIGTDGYARISYITYDSPNQLHYIKCTNASCSSNTDTLVDVSNSTGLTNFYTATLAIGADGYANILYDNYGASKALKLAQCTNEACSTKNLTTLTTSTGYLENSQIQMASDGFARIAFVDEGSPNQIRYIKCTNASCSANSNNLVFSAAGSLYYISMELGLDGFGRIFFSESSGGGYQYIQCTNDLCTSKALTTIEASSTSFGVSARVSSDGKVSLLHSRGNGSPLIYTKCLSDDCVTKTTTVISSTAGGAPLSFAFDTSNLPHIFYAKSSGGTILSYTKFGTSNGVPVINNAGSSLGSSSNPYSNLYANGLSLYEDTYLLSSRGVLNIGASSSAFDGTTNGYFNGSSSGTQIAVNASSSFGGNFIDLQQAGSSKFKVSSAGVTVQGINTTIQNGQLIVTSDATGDTQLAQIISTNNVGKTTALWTANSASAFHPNSGLLYGPELQIFADGNAGAGKINFYTNAASAWVDIPKVTFTNTGIVAIGLGNTAPDSSTKLHVSGHTRIDGGLCIRNATACPSYSNGRLYVDTAGTVGGDDPGDVFDIAEMYAADSVSAGDVITADSTVGRVKKTTEFGELELPSVTKAKKAYTNILGVVSTRPAITIAGHYVITGPDGQKENADLAQVALTGRVPVKVSTENGEIQIGDYLTSSKLFPGYAMKATRSGEVIGQALEPYISTEAGKVLVFLKPGYQVINNTFVLDVEDGQLTSQIFKIETNNQDTALLVNQKGSGNLLTLQRDGTDSFIVKNNGSVYLSSNIQEVALPVLNVSNQDKKLFVVYASGNIEITGNIKVAKDTAGTAVVKMGDNRAEVVFQTAYQTIPKITLAPVGSFIPYFIEHKTEAGFTIVLKEPAPSDISFDWIALEQPQETQSNSKLLIESFAPANPEPVVNEAKEQDLEPVATPEPEENKEIKTDKPTEQTPEQTLPEPEKPKTE